MTDGSANQATVAYRSGRLFSDECTLDTVSPYFSGSSPFPLPARIRHLCCTRSSPQFLSWSLLLVVRIDQSEPGFFAQLGGPLAPLKHPFRDPYL